MKNIMSSNEKYSARIGAAETSGILSRDAAVARAILGRAESAWSGIGLPSLQMRESEILALKTAHSDFLATRYAEFRIGSRTYWVGKALSQLNSSGRRMFALLGMGYQNDRIYRANLAAGRDSLVNVPGSRLAFLLKRIVTVLGPQDYLRYLSCVNDVARLAGYTDLTEVLCLHHGWKGRTASRTLLAMAGSCTPDPAAPAPAVPPSDETEAREQATGQREDFPEGHAGVLAKAPAEVQPAILNGDQSRLSAERQDESRPENQDECPSEGLCDAPVDQPAPAQALEPATCQTEKASAEGQAEDQDMNAWHYWLLHQNEVPEAILSEEWSWECTTEELNDVLQELPDASVDIAESGEQVADLAEAAPVCLTEASALPLAAAPLQPLAENRFQNQPEVPALPLAAMPASPCRPLDAFSFKGFKITDCSLSFNGLPFNSHRYWTSEDFANKREHSCWGFVTARLDNPDGDYGFDVAPLTYGGPSNARHVLVPFEKISDTMLKILVLVKNEPDEKLLLLARLYREGHTSPDERGYAMAVLDYAKSHPESGGTLLGMPKGRYPEIFRHPSHMFDCSEITGRQGLVPLASVPAPAAGAAPARRTGSGAGHAGVPIRQRAFSASRLRAQPQRERQKTAQTECHASAVQPAGHPAGRAHGAIARFFRRVGEWLSSLTV